MRDGKLFNGDLLNRKRAVTPGSMIKPISYAEILECPDLLTEYAAECSIPEIGPINPQREMYAALENAGIMKAFAAFNAEKLIGFATVLTTVIPHYGQKIATLESLFVSKKFRNSGAGGKLMDAVESYAKEAACVGILYSAPAAGQLERLLAASKKYKRTNAVFYRSL